MQIKPTLVLGLVDGFHFASAYAYPLLSYAYLNSTCTPEDVM